MKREVDLNNFTSVSNNWLIAIASHPAAAGKVPTCHAVTDEGLNTIRRHLSLLQELRLDECHHFSSVVLSKVWKDCKQLHTLSVRGCPGVTDAFLQCVANTHRSSAAYTLRSLDVRQCKNLTSSGISYLASSSIKYMAMHNLAVDDCLSVDNRAFFAFETSLGLRSLRSLSLSGLGIDETAISWIIKGCGASLQRLDVARSKSLSDFALLLMAPLILSPLFVKLNMRECPLITDMGIKNLFSLEVEMLMNTNFDDDDDDTPRIRLASLNLSNCPNIGDESMALVGKHCGNLVKLNLKGLRKVSDSGCGQITDFGIEALASRNFQLKVLLLANTRGISDRTLTALAFTKIPLEIIDLSGNTRITDEGLLALCTNCQQIQELRVKGCDRLSQKVVKRCNDNLLPFTKPFMTASLIKTIATGGGNSAMVLEPLPKVHIELLRLLHEHAYTAVIVVDNDSSSLSTKESWNALARSGVGIAGASTTASFKRALVGLSRKFTVFKANGESSSADKTSPSTWPTIVVQQSKFKVYGEGN
ncbi:unnamed protein product [Phytophthora fragariaefolia]|uniref:Unnamed protein product n=1 Tax=Phytophthora fragariaefolia TaxID=1490495 RepID=A0A9W6XXC2_9STRA|nr:unnamed protein product [Phytophthora fragariaefolia]